MNKERYNQIIDEVYEIYINKLNYNEKDCHVDDLINKPNNTFVPYNQEEFINKCKTDPQLSEEWGLKIEERELSLEERHNIALPIWKEKYGALAEMMVKTNIDNTRYKIPTKLITITHQNESIQFYE